MRPVLFATRSLFVVAAVCALTAFVPSVQGAVALSDLIMEDASIISGDKLFDHFSYTATGDMPSASNVTISAIDISGDYGIRVFGSFIDMSGDGASTANLSYRVSVLDPELGVSGASLYANPAVLKSGYFTIEESFPSLPLPTQLAVFDAIPGGMKLADTVGLNSVYSSLNVELSLTGESTSEVGAVDASFVDQTFSQGVVPEPGSMLIWMGSALLFGMVSIAHRRWVPHLARPE